MNRRTSFAVSFIVIAAFIPPRAKSQTLSTTTHAQAPTAVAARRTGPVSIDGKLDEAAWQAATPITNFTQLDPQEGQPASEKTEARILIDDDALYVGMRLYDSRPELIQSQLARRDESIEGDLAEVMIDSYHDHVTGVIFRLSPAGAKRDATLSSNGNQDNSWDAVWDGASSVDKEGWTAEFRIPLSQLRYNRNVADQVWGIQLDRKIARKAELAFFSFTPKNQQQGIYRYGHLTGLGSLPSTRKIELVPYVLARNENPGSVAANDPFRKQNSIAPGAGLDLKVGLTSNLTMNATFNPDFGQVEVDPAVVNLSAFETFFPERRPFFIEGRSIFSFGGMRTNNSSNGYTFFHTRRIGRQPQRFIGASDVAFVDAPIETTIAAATKLTGRSRGGWSLGVLDALTTREEARIRTTSGADRDETVEPLANYFIGRLKRDLRQGNTTVGFGLTATNRNLDESYLRPIFRRAAYAGGIDWNHAWSNRVWAFDGNIVFTDNIGTPEAIDALQTSPARYYQRPDKENYRRDPGRTSLFGYVAEMTLAKLSGLHWTGTLTYQEYNPGFELNEAGFLGSTDMRGIAPLVAYSENRPGKHLRNWAQYLFWNPSWDFDNNMTFNGVGFISVGELPSFWTYFMRADWRPPVLDGSLTRGGPLAALPTGYAVATEINSDRRKKYTYGFFANYSWNAARGNGFNFNPRLQIRPSTALRITLQPSYNRTHGMAQFVTRSVDALATDTYGTRYVFSTLNQKTLAMVTRVDWTFTPTLSLQLFAQPLLASGDFLDYKEFRLPRNFKFDIYGRDKGTIARNDATRRYTVDPDGAGPALPFTFGDRDFNQRSLRGNAVVRWEYRPGSALFFVWQQSRFGQIGEGNFDFSRDSQALFDTKPENVFVIKGTWWIGR